MLKKILKESPTVLLLETPGKSHLEIDKLPAVCTE